MNPASRDKRQPLVVEFFGLPGAGKTTVCHLTGSLLSKKNMSVAFRKDLVACLDTISRPRKAWEIGLHPVWFLRHYISLLRANRSRGLLADKSCKRLLSFLCKFSRLDSCKQVKIPDIFILDEWIIQQLWSIWSGLRCPGATQIEKLLFNAIGYRNYLCVYFAIPPHEAATRIFGRYNGKSKFDGLPLEATKKGVSTVFDEGRFPAKILMALEKKSRHFMILDALASPAINANIVAQRIACIMHGNEKA